MIAGIRWLLSFVLLYMSYTETGPFTTLILFLVLLSTEIDMVRK